MRYLAPTAAIVLLTAMLFSSCTCHDKAAERPIDDSASDLNIIVLPTATVEGQADKAETTPTPATTAAKTPTAEPRLTFTPPDHLPTDFPSDVPIVPGSTLAQVQDMANSARDVLFTSEKAVPELVKTYRDTLTKQGWRVTQEFETDKQAFASYEKGKMLVNVRVMIDIDHPGQNVIAVMYEEQKPLDFPEFDGDE